MTAYRTATTKLPRAKSRRGFALTEFAIVLGIMTIVFAGIWAAARTVYKRQSLEEATELVQIVAENLRTLYAGRALALPAGCPGFPCNATATLVTNGSIFPQGTVRTIGATTLPYGPWNNNQIRVMFIQNRPSTFEIELDVPNTEVCIGLLNQLQANMANQEGAPTSMAYTANGGTTWTIVKGTDVAGGTDMTTSDIITSVTTAGACNTVKFRFVI